MLVANYTTDEIIAAFQDIPQRTVYRYLDTAFIPETQVMLNEQASGLELGQSIAVLRDQFKIRSRKMDAILDDVSAPAKDRVAARSTRAAQLDLAVLKLNQETPNLLARYGHKALVDAVEAILKNPLGYTVATTTTTLNHTTIVEE